VVKIYFYSCSQNVIFSLDLKLDKLVIITTDEGRNKTGINIGLQGIIHNEMKLKELSAQLFFIVSFINIHYVPKLNREVQY